LRSDFDLSMPFEDFRGFVAGMALHWTISRSLHRTMPRRIREQSQNLHGGRASIDARFRAGDLSNAAQRVVMKS
jgi:hypothetical protein